MSELNEGIAKLKEAIEIIAKTYEPAVISVAESLQSDCETLEDVIKEMNEHA